MSNLDAASASLTEHCALHLELVMPSVFVDILWTKSYSMWHTQIERLEKGTAYLPQEYQELNILQRFPDVLSVSDLCLHLMQQVSSPRDLKTHSLHSLAS